MNTVGKKGRLGESIRCVVSVSMLTEGWDANTVTHILGVRAFGTQLLCEQVVVWSIAAPVSALGPVTHVDDAIMGGTRTDLSFTLFLSEEASYEGGALVVEDALEARSVKLAPGDMVLYPSNTLHHVEPVSSGERLAVVGWAQSWVREPERREVLFDLEQSLNEVHGREGKSALFDRLAKTRTNLLRMWADG